MAEISGGWPQARQCLVKPSAGSGETLAMLGLAVPNRTNVLRCRMSVDSVVIQVYNVACAARSTDRLEGVPEGGDSA
jgi:hypothetical protein